MGPHGSRDKPRLLMAGEHTLPFGVGPPGKRGGAFKRAALHFIEVERRDEKLERFFVRRAAHPALERADPVDADPGAFG
jgi:hypothetical protein